MGADDALQRYTRETGVEVRSPHSRLIAFALAFFVGAFGVHRFYVGKFWTGLFQLLTAGGFGVWWIIDCILIVLGRFKDGEGRVLGPPRTQRRLPPAQRRSKPPQLEDRSDDAVDDDLLRDPLEDEFAELERQMKDGERK